MGVWVNRLITRIFVDRWITKKDPFYIIKLKYFEPWSLPIRT